MPGQAPQRADVVRLVSLAVLVAGLAVAVVTGVTPGVEEIRGWVAVGGPASPVLFVVACAVGSVALVPKPLLSVAGGLMFGPLLGAGVVVTGVTCGALISFGIARLLGREAIRAGLRGGKLARVDEMLERRGFVGVVVLRLVPIVPFGVVNYTAGLSRLGVGVFGLGTAAGVLPATVLYTATGASLETMAVGEWFFVATLLGVLGLVGVVLVWAVKREGTVGRGGGPAAVAAGPPVDQPPV